MTHIKSTIEYLLFLGRGKRLLTIGTLATPVGFALAWLLPSGNYTKWIVNYKTTPNNFLSIFTFDVNILHYGIASLATILLVIASASIMVSVISRSLRVGVFHCRKPFSDFNDSLLPVFAGTSTFVIMIVVYKIALTLFLTLAKAIRNYYVSLTFSMITLIIMIVIASIAFSLMSLYIPIMSIMGVRYKEAMVMSIRKTNHRIAPIAVGMWTPIIVKTVVGSLVALLKMALMSFIVDIVLNTLLFAYLVSYMMITYYDIENLNREDYDKYKLTSKDRKLKNG
ncbi:MAG: hypothetical protein LBE09_01790 [Christensenellaceae bacterium]|jgi:hypothetical protein|nr:hypothetical protein [Christensenellaceae bacterium]